MQDSNNSNPEQIESPVPSPEPSPAPNAEDNGPINVPPGMGLREINATYEMLVKFHEAIIHNKWEGTHVQTVAMGLQMVVTMESQYRAQVERMRIQEKDAVKRARQAIQEAGGKIHGDAANNGTVPTEPIAG